jgi:hypothetical protein
MVLAEHVDFWEEDAIRSSWQARELTEFMSTCGFADADREPEFRAILAAYVLLSVDSNTIRSRTTDDGFHSGRRETVRDAIYEIKRWIGNDAGPLPRAGLKRVRE